MNDATRRTPKGPISLAPPHNTEVEAALLGAILTNNRVFTQVADFLEPDHFSSRCMVGCSCSWANGLMLAAKRRRCP